MLMVETELRPSPIHGIGVFLLQPVRQGELIWRFDSRIDRVYTEEELETFPEHMKRFLRVYSTWHEPTRLWVLCGDNARHFNHSDAPTTISNAISFGEDRAAADLDGRHRAHLRLPHDLRHGAPERRRLLTLDPQRSMGRSPVLTDPELAPPFAWPDRRERSCRPAKRCRRSD